MLLCDQNSRFLNATKKEKDEDRVGENHRRGRGGGARPFLSLFT